MPVGIGAKLKDPAGLGAAAAARPRGFHPGAFWLAALSPVVATLLLLARLAA